MDLHDPAPAPSYLTTPFASPPICLLFLPVTADVYPPTFEAPNLATLAPCFWEDGAFGTRAHEPYEE